VGILRTALLADSVSTRKRPVNLEPGDLWLFEHELQRTLPGSCLLDMRDVRISADGILFKAGRILPESFAFGHLLEEWTPGRRLQFLAGNYLLKIPTRIETDALWIVDDWSRGYYHWLADTLPRLFLVREHLKDWTLLLPHYAGALPFVEPSLAPFGVGRVRYIREDEVLACHRLFVPTHAAPPGHFNDAVIRSIRQVLVTAYGRGGEAPTDRLYISRSQARRRRVSNEADVLDVLKGFGFRVFHPESCPFEEQVRVASGSRYLVSSHGAGLTNMLFMRPGSHVLELRHQSDRLSNCYFTMASALDLHYSYQTCASPDPEAPPHVADLCVDLRRLERNLEQLLARG
jgi:capsular polysaccharide biosynthesis protein